MYYHWSAHSLPNYASLSTYNASLLWPPSNHHSFYCVALGHNLIDNSTPLSQHDPISRVLQIFTVDYGVRLWIFVVDRDGAPRLRREERDEHCESMFSFDCASA